LQIVRTKMNDDARVKNGIGDQIGGQSEFGRVDRMLNVSLK